MKTFEDSPEAIDVIDNAVKRLVYKVGNNVYYAGICAAMSGAWRDYCLARGVAAESVPCILDMFPYTFQIIEDLLTITKPTIRGRLIWELDVTGYQNRINLLTSICTTLQGRMDTYVKVTFHRYEVQVHYVGQDTIFYGANYIGI
jgi:hypothetical protein